MYGNYGLDSFGGYSGGLLSGIGTASILILILALAGAIVIMALFLPKKKRGSYQGFAAQLYDFLNFNTYWLPTIVKATYLFFTLFSILSGLYVMIALSFLTGLLTMVFGPVLMRLVYEMAFLFYSMREQLKHNNELLETIAKNTGSAEVPKAAEIEPETKPEA